MFGLFGSTAGFGLEAAHGVLRAAAVNVKGGTRTIARLDSIELPAGTVIDSFTKPNIVDTSAFTEALKKLAGRMGHHSGSVNLALPDFVARVVILDFESLPKKAEDADRMIKWRLKKLMPFDVEEATLRHQYLGAVKEKDTQSHRFVSAVIKSDILGQYEKVFSEAGLRPGRIDIASFSLWNLYRDFILADARDVPFAVLNMCCGKMTVMVFEGGMIRFFRLKDLGVQGDATGCPMLDPIIITRELRSSLTYFKEHVSGTQVGLVYMAGYSDAPEEAAAALGQSAGVEVRALVIDKVLASGGVMHRPAEGVLYGAACGAALER